MSSAPVAPKSVLMMAVLVEGGLALLAVVLGWFFDAPPLRSVPTADVQELGWQIGLGAVATVPMLAALLAVEWLPLSSVRQFRQLLQDQVVPVFCRLRMVEFAFISALAGIGEEMFFRGFLQSLLDGLLTTGLGPWPAIFLAAVVFGLAHCISPAYVVLATLVGIYLGYLYWTSRGIVAPAVAHGLYDFLALVYLVKIRPGNKRSSLK